MGRLTSYHRQRCAETAPQREHVIVYAKNQGTRKTDRLILYCDTRTESAAFAETEKPMTGMIQSGAAGSIQRNQPVREKKFWPRERVLGLLPLLIGFAILVWIAYLPSGLHAVAVFRT